MGVKTSKLRYIHVDAHTHTPHKYKEAEEVQTHTQCMKRSQHMKDLTDRHLAQ